MELIGLLFALPVLFVLGVSYWYVVRKIPRHISRTKTTIIALSSLVVSLVFLEFMATSFIGISWLHEQYYTSYFVMHSVLFVLLVPSTLNLIMLNSDSLNRFYFIGLFSMLFGFLALLFHVHLSEMLFGIE